MKPLSEASNELFHAANQIIQWLDSENTHSKTQWRKAYTRLRIAVRNYNEVQCTNLVELIRKG